MLNLESQPAELNNQELATQQQKQEQFQILADLTTVEPSNATTDAARDLLEVEQEIKAPRKASFRRKHRLTRTRKRLAAKSASRKGSGSGPGKEILSTLKQVLATSSPPRSRAVMSNRRSQTLWSDR